MPCQKKNPSQNPSCKFINLPFVLCSCYTSRDSWQNSKKSVCNIIDFDLVSQLKSLFAPSWRGFRLSLHGIDLMRFSLVPQPHKFKGATWLAARSDRFNVELSRCNLYFCPNTSHMRKYLLIYFFHLRSSWMNMQRQLPFFVFHLSPH